MWSNYVIWDLFLSPQWQNYLDVIKLRYVIKLFGGDQTSYVYEIVLIVSYVYGKKIEDKIKAVNFMPLW